MPINAEQSQSPGSLGKAEHLQPRVADISKEIVNRLSAAYGEGEARAMMRLIFAALKNWSATDLIIHSTDEVSDYILSEIGKILYRLENGEPIQYILGKARFYGMDLKVDRNVLIPRPETEELVEIIASREGDRKDLRVLDVGSGSGAIAIALSRLLKFPEVTALDLSEGALRVAEENAKTLHANIRFVNADIFTKDFPDDSFDVIVSNPPYICEKEKEEMEGNVLNYEPHSALFVPDDDPLLFYRRIAHCGLMWLSPGGRLYFEINPVYARQLKDLLIGTGYSDVEILEDISHKLRFALCRKPLKR